MVNKNEDEIKDEIKKEMIIESGIVINKILPKIDSTMREFLEGQFNLEIRLYGDKEV